MRSHRIIRSIPLYNVKGTFPEDEINQFVKRTLHSIFYQKGTKQKKIRRQVSWMAFLNQTQKWYQKLSVGSYERQVHKKVVLNNKVILKKEIIRNKKWNRCIKFYIWLLRTKIFSFVTIEKINLLKRTLQ